MGCNIQLSDVRGLIELALIEDLGGGDITSQAIFSGSDFSEAVIAAKERGVLCGTEMAGYIYGIIDPNISVIAAADDGETIDEGTEVIRISGPTIGVLSGERTVLNFMQRMSGIATNTSHIVSLLKGSKIKLLDTRKTAPGFRILDKYAVKTGGGENHRMGLFDMVLIKDNHIKAAGGIKNAVDTVRARHGSSYRIEVEASSLEEVKEAAECGVDIIMLDNMGHDICRAASRIIDGRAKIEISGNMNEEKIKEMVDLDIDYISMGALTHSVRAFDFSMRITQGRL